MDTKLALVLNTYKQSKKKRKLKLKHAGAITTKRCTVSPDVNTSKFAVYVACARDSEDSTVVPYPYVLPVLHMMSHFIY